ncbi:cytochrome b/b6 domain-containing protein [Devosia sp. Root436]|uniref:cytochrome b n=1 Tax=Devosia sp. Root436 TaxID=1736537 RepID=UPI00138F400B|nr:cytochrome b/b6 domain-containing protein [Devosia sp. Root436]
MSLTSSPTRYGAVAIAIHWLTAIAIIGMLASGLTAANTGDEAVKLNLLRGHAIMGVLIGVLTLLRIVWWLAFDQRPADAAGLSRGQSLASHVVHYGLYAVILVMVASGIATVILSGGGAQLAGAAPLPLPDFTLAPPFSVHGLLARGLLVLLAGHIGAALWHQFVRRDRLLARMGVGS